MNKKFIQSSIAVLFLLTACSQAPESVTPLAFATSTQNQRGISTSTLVLIPSKTPREPRNEPTNTPVTPTVTPTLFDPQKITTATPAPGAKCSIKSTDKPNLDFLNNIYGESENKANLEQNILDYLNKYDPLPLVNSVRDGWYQPNDHVAYQDLTNDGQADLAMGRVAFYIFGCNNGQYGNLLEIPPDGYLQPAKIFSIKDNNRNGIPEITLLTGFMSQGGHTFEVYEWDGEKFENILPPYDPKYPNMKYLWVEATGEIHYEDVDKDTISELILDSGIPVWETYYSGLPWRNERTYYKWNGEGYYTYKKEFAPPQFRFQAVQDGDLAVKQEELDKALRLYQDVIFSDKVSGYSPKIRENLQATWEATIGQNPIPTPYPIDNAEYPKLAAYAYFRIMLVRIAQGYESDAGTVYKTLLQKFGNDPYGHPYVEMATAFWDTFQATRQIQDGCAAAIRYANKNFKILIPLGSDYHGSQSHTYVPADVCPFR